MRVFARLVVCVWLVTLPAPSQTVRIAGSVRAMRSYRHPIGRGLVVEVTTGGIAIRRAKAVETVNYAACATPPAHGPNPLDIEGWHFNPPQSGGAPGLRREFAFALTANANQMECALAEAGFQEEEVPGYRPQRLGRGVLTLSDVKLTPTRETVASFRFVGAVTLPRKH